MAGKRRLFFALWPGDALRSSIVDVASRVAEREQVGGRPVPLDRLHMTLLYLGDCTAEEEAAARHAASGLQGRAFDLSLDRAGSFYRARVFWLGASRKPDALTDLWLALRAGVAAAGVPHDPKALAPHVTCARDVYRPIDPVPIEPLAWPVRAFVLVHSEMGSHPQYHVVSHWPLQTVAT